MRFHWLVCFLVAGSALALADDSHKQLVHAFSVAKETNHSFVSYDARLTPDCQIDKKDPLDLYWVTPLQKGGARRDGLNFFEKNLYGMDVEKEGPTALEGEVKAIKKRGVKLNVRIVAKKSGDKCSVQTLISGDKLPSEVVVESLYLQHFSGSKPTQVAIKGRDQKSGKSAEYVVNFA